MIDPTFIILYQKNLDSLAMKAVVDMLVTAVSKHEYSYLNIILGRINFNRLDNGIIVAILRTTFEVREKLSHWESFHAKAKKKLTGTNMEKHLLALA